MQLHESCEHCRASLPPSSDQAWICSYEHTFCATCTTDSLRVGGCPRCGGELLRRPRRPTSAGCDVVRQDVPSASWFRVDLDVAVNLQDPGIYEWCIEGSGRYIGRSLRLRRRLREYIQNVANLHAGTAYRANSPAGFRGVHRALAAAAMERREVIFRVIENCPPADLVERERYWIARRGDLNGSARTSEPLNAPPAPPRSPQWQQAVDKIVASVENEETPQLEAVETWISGGAIFWDESHILLARGIHVATAVYHGERVFEAVAIRNAVSNADGLSFRKFGIIPLASSSGATAVCLTKFSSFTGDEVHHFYRDEASAEADLREKGWLLSEQHDVCSELDRTSDETLLYLASLPAKGIF